MEFRAHIYYDRTCREQALGLQRALRHHFGHVAIIHELMDQRRAPHLWPNFEVSFHEDDIAPLRGFLADYHGRLPILIRPVTSDRLADYGHRAEWIGQELPLDWIRV